MSSPRQRKNQPKLSNRLFATDQQDRWTHQGIEAQVGSIGSMRPSHQGTVVL
jgi:hypothetical protein